MSRDPDTSESWYLGPATVLDRHETPRARLAVGAGDHANQSRSEKIRGLIRMELYAMGGGDPVLGQYGIHPLRILEAVDAGPHLPASGLWVNRPRTGPEMREARALRERRDKSPDEMLVSLAIADARSGLDTAGEWARAHPVCDVYLRDRVLDEE